MPRTMNSRSPSSRSRPPTSRLLRAQGVRHVADGDAVGREPLGVDDDLVLLLEAADGGDLGDALDGLELGLEVEVLGAPELRQVVACPVVSRRRVRVDPADARRVRPERGVGALGEAVVDLVEVLEHAAARPVEVGAVLEDDVDEARPEHRVAADGLGAGHGEEGRRERVGHLLLDDLRPLSGVVRPDDDLDVGEVRDGVDGRGERGPGAEAATSSVTSPTRSRLWALHSMRRSSRPSCALGCAHGYHRCSCPCPASTASRRARPPAGPRSR